MTTATVAASRRPAGARQRDRRHRQAGADDAGGHDSRLVRGGHRLRPAGAAGLAHFVSRTIDRGTETRTADEIAEELDSRGVSLDRHRQPARAVARLHLPGRRPPGDAGAPGRHRDAADVSRKPKSSNRRGEIITLIRQDEDNPAAVANEALMAALYGEAHPYGTPAARQRRERRGASTAPTLRRFHAERFRPAALSLVMVGDVEPATGDRRRPRRRSAIVERRRRPPLSSCSRCRPRRSAACASSR